MNPLEIIKSAIAAVPAMKYALAVVALAAVISIVSALKIDYRVSVIGAIVVVILMVILLLFAKLSTYKNSFFALPALVFTWFSLAILISVSLMLFSSVFFQWPVDLQFWINPNQSQTNSIGSNKYRRVYFDSFNDKSEESDKLSPVWLIGTQGDWSGSVANGKYQICNIVDNTSSSYTSRVKLFTNANDREEDLSHSKIRMYVKVEGKTGKHSGVGILYRKSVGKIQYYAYILNAGESVSLYRAIDGKIKILWSEDISSILTSDSVNLEVTANGNTI